MSVVARSPAFVVSYSISVSVSVLNPLSYIFSGHRLLAGYISVYYINRVSGLHI